jgi:FkbM family methyltransferase
LPPRLPVSHFQLMRSCVNLHVYPHMRPDLKPAGFGQDHMHGFQATHRDAIADLPDPQLRASLMEHFRPKPDDVILDCGAFLGFGDIAVAPLVPQGRIVAIEAKAANHALQRKNLEWNRIANVTPIHRGVWCDTREIDLQTSHAHANTLVAEVHTGDDTERVHTTGIDELVAELSLPKVDMISLTLNGAEVEALDGAQDTLRRHKPRIRAAGWYRREGRLIADMCRERLEPQGYRVTIGARGNLLAVAR